MAITDDLRKTLSNPTPAYFVAGSADLAIQQAKKVPGLVEQLIAEAPSRIEAVRNTDPKAVQDKAGARAKEAQETLQAKVAEVLGTIDTDLKKLGETAQDLALRGVGVAAELAVKAREKYDEVAEHGEQAVKSWRGEAAEEILDLAETVEPDDEPKPAVTQSAEPKGPAVVTPKSAVAAAPVKKPAAKKAPAKKPAAKKTTPPAK
ncbi:MULTISPECIES: hypothetical protein [Streptomyces]|uniref:Heparin-binding hemagglutinin n=1 Tax=Streptomyces venezuelae TaxID=54571 RepID=A0A5P2BFU8_STRVZ|nr:MULTISPECIES: hypothetical protein [Streptomyces]NEA00345.1 hypothetical protein [Streptomyces sp. SID10116]MYY83358.1 hypothetical protein [Streptomyces sp. SID335]MYZ13811.1 hypothetical protein [Streptomyces sp. SID337]NDZ86036.1 hypothetical protein [Streptomyces sp. SID10115]NEB43003.1 hypothetical protein [Streptomyces sp. SID339]